MTPCFAKVAQTGTAPPLWSRPHHQLKACQQLQDVIDCVFIDPQNATQLFPERRNGFLPALFQRL